MNSEPSDIVEAGYDRIAYRHLAWIDQIKGDPRFQFLEDLLQRLPDRPNLLDLGCGAGVPCTARLAEHGDVVGVDISAGQLALARTDVLQQPRSTDEPSDDHGSRSRHPGRRSRHHAGT